MRSTLRYIEINILDEDGFGTVTQTSSGTKQNTASKNLYLTGKQNLVETARGIFACKQEVETKLRLKTTLTCSTEMISFTKNIFKSSTQL